MYEGFEETYFSKFHFSHLQNAYQDPTIKYTYNFLMKIYLFILRFYFFIRESGRESKHRQTEWQAEAEGEAGSWPSKEPDAGLDPRMLGS